METNGFTIKTMLIKLIHTLRYTDVIGCTVKPVYKGHCDEGTPCNQGTLSQNRVLSLPC